MAFVNSIPNLYLFIALVLTLIVLGGVVALYYRYRLLSEDKRLQLVFISNDNENLKVQVQELSEKKQQLEWSFVKCRADYQNSQEKEKLLNQQLSLSREELKQALQALQNVQQKYSDVQSELLHKEKFWEMTESEVKRSRDMMKVEFEALAKQVFDTQHKVFEKNNEKQLTQVTQPLQKELESFQNKVEQLHINEVKQQTLLNSELKTLRNLNQNLSEEAQQLTQALKGNKKHQGIWGEMILEKVLEQSGLVLDRDYKREVSLKNQQGVIGRPDVLVCLPGNRHLIVDAKTSLNHYSNWINSDKVNDKKKALEAHIQAIKTHIKTLSKKDYAKLEGINSPEIVFMFIPIESALLDALHHAPSLLTDAQDKGVFLTTPSTLMMNLQIVKQLWRYENQSQHLNDILKKADSLYQKSRRFLESFLETKQVLEKMSTSFDKTERQLYLGKGNLISQLQSFEAISQNSRDKLPSYFIEKMDNEIDSLKSVE